MRKRLENRKIDVLLGVVFITSFVCAFVFLLIPPLRAYEALWLPLAAFGAVSGLLLIVLRVRERLEVSKEKRTHFLSDDSTIPLEVLVLGLNTVTSQGFSETAVPSCYARFTDLDGAVIAEGFYFVVKIKKVYDAKNTHLVACVKPFGEEKWVDIGRFEKIYYQVFSKINDIRKMLAQEGDLQKPAFFRR